MNFKVFNLLKPHFSSTWKFKIPNFTSPLQFQSTTSNPLLRRSSKLKHVSPIGWFLLIVPASTFSLGVWQVQRKKWKESLIAELLSKTSSDPIPLPESLEDISKLEYRPIHVKGYFLHDKESYIGPRSLLLKGDAATQSTLMTGKGNTTHGYQVITPFKLANRNETILINRGWVHAKKRNPSTRQKGQVEGIVDVIGIVRLHENRPTFTPKNQGGSNIYFYRDLQQLAATAGTLPILLDATNEFDVPEGPIGGQTRISLRNEHLSYILTWFTLCGATSFMWYTKFLK